MKEALQKAIVMGVQVANIHVPATNLGYTHNVRLELHQSSGVDDGAYYPAESFSVCGRNQIVALRDLLNEAIEYSEYKPKEENK